MAVGATGVVSVLLEEQEQQQKVKSSMLEKSNIEGVGRGFYGGDEWDQSQK